MADPVTLQLASDLADECISVQTETGDDRLFMEMAQVIGASSQTLEEAFLTAVRTRMASKAGKEFLVRKLEEHRGGTAG